MDSLKIRKRWLVIGGADILLLIVGISVYFRVRNWVPLTPQLGDLAWAPEDVVAQKQRVITMDRGEPQITTLSLKCTIPRGTTVRVLARPDSAVAVVRVTGYEESKPTGICNVGAIVDVDVVRLRRLNMQ